ncbi:MAG: hypothetical protein ACO3JL_05210, partial [Myxococcota bacterium]
MWAFLEAVAGPRWHPGLWRKLAAVALGSGGCGASQERMAHDGGAERYEWRFAERSCGDGSRRASSGYTRNQTKLQKPLGDVREHSAGHA